MALDDEDDLDRSEVLDEIEDLLDEEDYEEALALCDRLIMEDPDDGEVLALRGEALANVGEFEEALDCYDRVLALDPEADGIDSDRAYLLCELARIDEAVLAGERGVASDPKSPSAHYWLAVAHELAGNQLGAERHYRQANKLNPEEFHLPTRVSDDEFMQVVAEVEASFPEELRTAMSNLHISVRDFPTPEIAAGDPPLGMLIYGFFDGIPLSERTATDAQTQGPSHIFLFKKNLERDCESRGELKEEIDVTLKHEIGHFFGEDEDDMERLGLD